MTKDNRIATMMHTGDAVEFGYETNYRQQANRCENCGHRKEVHDGTGCLVVTGYRGLPINDKACECKAHWRNQ